MGPPLGQAMEFLSQALSQRGPKAVPYPENCKYSIREHVSDLLKMFPALTVGVSEFHATDGRILHLIRAHGTIPIHYQAHKYNIPVVIWLPERYPVQAPLVYVTPTPNMIIRPGHPYVDASGLVRTPYLANWLHPSSDLSSMAQEMAMIFGTDPPLYSTPAEPSPAAAAAAAYPPPGQAYSGYGLQQPQQQQRPPPPPPPPAAAPSPTHGGPSPDPMVAGGQALWGGAYAAMHHQQQQQQQQPRPPSAAGWPPAAGPGSSGMVYPPPPPPAGAAAGSPGSSGPSPGGPPPKPPPTREQQELEAAFRSLAIKALNGRVQAGLEAYNRHAAGELDALLEAQRTLGKRDQELAGMVAAIQQERAGTEGLVAEMGSQCAALEAWLEGHEWKAAAVQQAGGAAKLDVNTVVVPADDLSRAAAAAQAEDLAVEDTLVVLDKALLAGKLEPDVYLKQVRLLCRQQFFARAKGLKVAQLQRQQPQKQRQAGAGACTLTHGDGWSHGQSTTMPLPRR